MKTVLILIPANQELFDRRAYVSACLENALKKKMVPFCYDLIKDYLNIPFPTYLKQTLPVVDQVIIYQDFGKGFALAKEVKAIDESKKIVCRNLFKKAQKGIYKSSLFDILNIVSEKTQIPIEELQSKSRKREVSDARFVFYRLAKERTKASLYKIGEVVKRDHATVLHGIREALRTKEVVELYNSIAK